MKSVAIDASSAILLYKSGLFESMAVSYALAMVPSVFQEVTHARRAGWDQFMRYQHLGQLTVLQLDLPRRIDPGLSSMGAGERDTITAYLHGHAEFVVLDDRKAARFCRSHQVPYTNALLCAKLLYWSGVVETAEFTDGWENLLAIGRYSPEIIDFAGHCSALQLSGFLP